MMQVNVVTNAKQIYAAMFSFQTPFRHNLIQREIFTQIMHKITVAYTQIFVLLFCMSLFYIHQIYAQSCNYIHKMLQNVESLQVQLTLHVVHVTTLTTECFRQRMQNYSRFVFCTYMRVFTDLIFRNCHTVEKVQCT